MKIWIVNQLTGIKSNLNGMTLLFLQHYAVNFMFYNDIK